MKDNRYPWAKGVENVECCDPLVKIRVKNLSLKYSGHAAFHNVDLQLNKGCVTGIIGPSGCGKSSFLQCLNRMTELVDEVEVEGDIILDDQSIFDSRIDLIHLRKKIGAIDVFYEVHNYSVSTL